MNHYSGAIIVDAKDIYTEYLINVLQPLLYEGFQSIYDKAIDLEKKYIDGSKLDPSVKNPGVIVIFQHYLLGLNNLNDNLIEDEAKRIRDNSKCADIFDDLIKAVIKSHIYVLTYTANTRSKLIDEKLHEKVCPKTFIHKCYVECSRLFYDHPYLFWHELPTSEIKENQRIMYQLVKLGIKSAIRRTLDMKPILEEFLNNDFTEIAADEYMRVKDMLNRDNTTMNGGNDDSRKILETESSTDSHFMKLENELNGGGFGIESLIYNRQFDDIIEDNLNEDNVPVVPIVPTADRVEQTNPVVPAVQVTQVAPIAPVVPVTPVVPIVPVNMAEHNSANNNDDLVIEKGISKLSSSKTGRKKTKRNLFEEEIEKARIASNGQDNYYDEMLN